jgi:hypothetical protein
MSDTVAVAYMQMDLKIVIDGKIYDCASFSMNYSLSGIPMAQACLSVGVCVLPGETSVGQDSPAMIHQTAGSILRMQPCSVYFKADGEWTPGGQSWPGGWIRIFKGYVTGFGSQKVRGSMRVTLNMVHWLADLEFSSSLSNQTHPSSCFQFSSRAVYVQDGLTASTGKPTNLGQHTGHALLTPGNISADLWGQCLQPLLCNIANKDLFKFKPNNACFAGAGKTNKRGLAALQLMEGNSQCGTSPSQWYVPLAMAVEEAASQLSKSISDYIGHQRLDSCVSQTLWSKLIGDYGANFFFAVSPRVESAIVFPYTAALQSTYTKELKAVDVSYLGIDAALSKPLRSVQVLGKHGFRMSNHDRNGPSVFNVVGAGGCYAPPGIEDDGLILVKDCPDWMANVGLTSHSANNTSMGKNRQPTPTATTPGAGFRGGEDGKTSADTHVACNSAYDRLAHVWYAAECLRGRFGVVYGKLRFDIAPGSTIAVENTQEIHLAASDALGNQNYVGMVTRVSIEIDAEGSRAGTGFQLASVRTNTENDNGIVSVPGNPIYNNAAWKGCPLVEEYLFEGD